MEGKLRQLMKHEGINSTRLAEILGIQASGISHIMSGRNKPSFDFLLKLLQRFPQINPDWLLLDKGPMYRDEIKNKSGQATSQDAGKRSALPGGMAGSNAAAGANVSGFTGSSGSSMDMNSGVMAGSGSPDGVGGFGYNVDAQYVRAARDIRDGAQNKPTMAQRGLFGPDNDDIIPSGGGYRKPGPSSGPGGYSESGGYQRSASIERIVVFYKDKTFSEYQPE